MRTSRRFAGVATPMVPTCAASIHGWRPTSCSSTGRACTDSACSRATRRWPRASAATACTASCRQTARSRGCLPPTFPTRAATATRTRTTWPSTRSRPTRKPSTSAASTPSCCSCKRDFSAPACNDCHGNHGAFPPGVSSIAEVCGQCHVNNAAFFERSPHKPAFDKSGLPECVACHGNHEIHRASDDMLGGQPGTVCRRCHEPGSPGYDGAVTMRDVHRPAEARHDRHRSHAATRRRHGDGGQ